MSTVDILLICFILIISAHNHWRHTLLVNNILGIIKSNIEPDLKILKTPELEGFRLKLIERPESRADPVAKRINKHIIECIDNELKSREN